MNLEERMNALLEWLDEPVSAGFGSAAAKRALGAEKASQTAQEAKVIAESIIKAQSMQSPVIQETETRQALRTEGRAAIQAEYDIASLRRDCFGQETVQSVRTKDLTRVEDPWQAQQPAAMSPGQMDLLLRTKWTRMSDRQRAQMTALQQCGHVPDRDMDLFLYAVSTLSELISRREVKRLLEQIAPRTRQSNAWKALHDALSARLDASNEVNQRHIDRVEAQLRMRELAYSQANEAYKRAQEERMRVQNSYF